MGDGRSSAEPGDNAAEIGKDVRKDHSLVSKVEIGQCKGKNYQANTKPNYLCETLPKDSRRHRFTRTEKTTVRPVCGSFFGAQGRASEPVLGA